MVQRHLNIFIVIIILSLFFVQLSSAVTKESANPPAPIKKSVQPDKSKIIFNLSPPLATQPDIFSAMLTAAQITVEFSVPKSGYAKENLPIRYQLSGIGLAAVEATAFENPEYLTRWIYTTSAFPKDMQIIFNYLGAVPTNKSGDYPKKSSLKLINRFSTNNYYLISFEIRNFGKTLLKSHGYGQVTYLLNLFDTTVPNLVPYPLPKIRPKPDFDLYPGDKQIVSYLIKPLPPGSYLLKMIAILNNELTIAETDLSITFIKANLPDPGLVIPETIPILAPPMFPTTRLEWQEPLHTFRVHELTEPDTLKSSGILNLPMPDKDGTVVLRLITPSGLATTSVTVTLEKHKKKKR